MAVVKSVTNDIRVPADAEMVLEGYLDERGHVEAEGPFGEFLGYYGVVKQNPVFHLTAITMRADKPIYRNHQTVPDTDHQPLPRLCHEAILYNRLTEIGLKVHDVRFPPWGGASGHDDPRDFCFTGSMTGLLRGAERREPGGIGFATALATVLRACPSSWAMDRWLIPSTKFLRRISS